MAFSVLTQKMSVVAPGAPALRARLPARPGAQRANPTICSAAKRPEAEPFLASKLAVPFAGALAAAMLLGAVLPEDALAARRARRVLLCNGCCVARAELDLVPFQAGMSGGRVGGSTFRSAPRSAPAPRSGGGGGGGGGATVRNYNYYGGPSIAPPLIGGYGYGGYGGGMFAPSIGLPVIGFGGFFNFIFFMFAVSAVLSVVRGLLSRRQDDLDD